MIDPKELRLGNFVCYRSDISGQEKEIEVEWTFFAEDFWTKNSRPIPLSPEWLERFGFKKESGQDNFSYHEGDGSVYYLSYNDKHSEVHAVSVCHPMIEDSHTAFAWHVKYVHQLQNIFYCILGKELELNP